MFTAGMFIKALSYREKIFLIAYISLNLGIYRIVTTTRIAVYTVIKHTLEY